MPTQPIQQHRDLAEGRRADGLLRVRDRPRRDLADLRSHRLRHQVLPRRHRHPRRLAARMRSAASAGPLSRPNGSSRRGRLPGQVR